MSPLAPPSHSPLPLSLSSLFLPPSSPIPLAQVVKKGDVASLLDSAGFSRSNPYYIVAQGKVQALTRMSDVDRLNVRAHGCIGCTPAV
jgi:hypothetical protein